MTIAPPPPLRGDATRKALIDAATLVFARDRFETANLREIAGTAQVNPALIGYHFRNKRGLYLAVFELMVSDLHAVIRPALTRMREATAQEMSKEARLEAILQLLDTMLTHIVRENPAWGELIVCEMQTPSAAYDVLHQGLIQEVTDTLRNLLAKLRPKDSSEHLGLLAGSIVTQVGAMRISRVPIMRLMGWEEIGEPERKAMRDLIRRNTRLIILGN